MNKYQQKAEAYVRQQLPELMELSFGCRVKVKTNNWIRLSTVFGESDKSFHIVTDTKVRCKPRIVYSNKDTDELEIIGHPIQLQHWLRVIGGREGAVLTDVETGIPVLDIQVGVTYMQFNLTTGQPATEEDYKAFCDIVGI